MANTTQEILRWGSERLRVSPWQGRSDVAHVAPLSGLTPLSVQAVDLTARALVERGYREVVTVALSPHEQVPFMEAGFDVRERLHLLVHDMAGLPPQPRAALRRGRRHDRALILDADTAAFGAFWQLDEAGLHEALHATPSARLQVVLDDHREVAGYAVTGRAGATGYLQRLAVHPRHQGRGWGRALAIDSLRWMRRRGVRRGLVNTQLENLRALELYRDLGYVDEPQGLAVLVRRLAADP